MRKLRLLSPAINSKNASLSVIWPSFGSNWAKSVNYLTVMKKVYIKVCVNSQNKKKLRCFLEKFTQLTKILHDRRSRRSRQISSLLLSLRSPKLVCADSDLCLSINFAICTRAGLTTKGQIVSFEWLKQSPTKRNIIVSKKCFMKWLVSLQRVFLPNVHSSVASKAIIRVGIHDILLG